MGKFLVGWELGGERGHVALLEPVVQALRDRGHEVVVAVKDLAGLAERGSCLAAGRLLQAPSWPDPQGVQSASSETVADDMTSAGLANAPDLQRHALDWLRLIRELETDVVLAESAPTLLLAARSRCRAIAFGSGYSLPPAGGLLAPVLDLQRPCSPASAAREENLRRAFDSADRALGGEGFNCFSDLFDVPGWVCNLPELDPYAGIRPARVPGPLCIRHADEAALQRRLIHGLGEKVFVYIKPFPGLPALLDALVPYCRRLELFIAHAPAGVHNPWPEKVTLHGAPIDLAARLPEFSAVVHFGGLNLAAEALFAGVPQAIVPQHLEQSATALAVRRLGVGHCRLGMPREPEREPERQALMTELFRDFFADAGQAQRAAELGTGLRARQKPSLPGLVELCESRLRS